VLCRHAAALFCGSYSFKASQGAYFAISMSVVLPQEDPGGPFDTTYNVIVVPLSSIVMVSLYLANPQRFRADFNA
jgi:hypothetical protein